MPGNRGEAGGDYPFQDQGNGLKQDDNSEGGGGVIGLLAWLVKDNAIGL